MQIYPQSLTYDLDFPHVLQELSKYCQNAAAKNIVANMAPINNDEKLLFQLNKTNELLSTIIAGDHFPSLLFDSISSFIKRFEVKGVVLDEEQFSHIRSLAGNYLQLYLFLEKKKDRLPLLFSAIKAINPEPVIIKEIDQRIDERSNVRSSASPALARIRNDLTKKRQAADRIFLRALKKYRDKGIIADIDESVSENRRVLAVQAAYKGQVQGIFHGSSSRHSISFIEPGETVEVNNEVAFLVDEEKQEIRRILKELSDILRPFGSILQQYEIALLEMDFTKAKALFAHAEDAVLPQISDEKRIVLKDAFNPALKIIHRTKGKPVKPLSLEMNTDQRLLVISGPNAGGKSIALKTLGLLQLMLQSGLLIPVHPQSHFFFFEQLMGDIGDSQSIENELSTYSSKLKKMRYFLEKADDQTLLLIDEFGSGSDPDLGSSLAQVFLEKLNSFRTMGIFTTHYNAIKAIAAETAGISNAAMLFDKSNFEPEYLLEIGNPGSSYTFEVAEKSGIGRHIIREARNRTSKNTLKVDQLLVQIQDEKLQIEKKRNQLNEELQSIKKLEAEKAVTIKKLEEKLQKQGRLNEENDRAIYWGQRFQKLVDSWMDQQTQKDKKAVIARFIGMLNQRSSETEKEETKQLSKAGQKRQQLIEKFTAEKVQIGDRVKLLENNMEGTIQEVKGEKFKIVVGDAISVLVHRDKFIPASARLETKPRPKKRKKSFSKKEKPKEENKKKSE